MVNRRSFDAFGKPRGGFDGSTLTKPKLKENDTQATTNFIANNRRGFTNHEYLDGAEIIHMNGRVYDYNLGRFMSVDPLIQSPTNSQSLNPYSYIMNNPLSGIDPSGYCAVGMQSTLRCSEGGPLEDSSKDCTMYCVPTLSTEEGNAEEQITPANQDVGEQVAGTNIGLDKGKIDTNQNGMSAGQALEAMGGVIKDHWKDILRGTIQSTRETSPVADALVDFAGAEEIVEGSINMAEGNIKAGVQSATVAALGKIKILRKAVDKISTGRTEPNSLEEKLAMEEVMSNPSGYTPPRMPKMSDTKNNLLHKDGWVKKKQNVNGVEIHYVENKNTKQVIDFKFKD